jgi:predicted phage tail component-like protein
MHNNYFLLFNNLNSKFDLGLSIVRRPNIPSTTINKRTVEIPGRDGLLYEELGGCSDITIPVEFNFIDRHNLKDRFRQIRAWVLNDKNKKLIFSDDPDWFYRVVDIKIDDFETMLRRKGNFKIDFICRGYMYRVDADEFSLIENNTTLYNYYIDAKPLIKLEGNGEVEININNNIFTVPVQDYIYIDSELELVYRTKDTYFNLGKGEFPILTNGTNNISYTGNITRFEIKTRWRCL